MSSTKKCAKLLSKTIAMAGIMAVTTPLFGYLPDQGNSRTEAYYHNRQQNRYSFNNYEGFSENVKVAVASDVTKAVRTYDYYRTEEVEVPKYGFVPVKDSLLPVSSNNAVQEPEKLLELPDQYRSNFKIEISGRYNGDSVKLFYEPNGSSAVPGKYYLPTKFIIDDLKVYNGKYFKIRDGIGHDYFIDAEQSNWNLIGGVENLQIIGFGENRTVQERVKNYTLEVNERTNLSYDEITNIIAGTGIEGCEDAIMEIEEKYGINALFTIALAGVESGWGSSWLAEERNNLFGICAYDSNTDAATFFASKADCIRYWGKLIAFEYFDEGCTTLEAINEYYASNPNWASDVRSIMSSMLSEV